MKAPKESKYKSTLDKEGFLHRVYAAIRETFRHHSATRMSILPRKLCSLVCDAMETPYDVLFWMEDINRQLKFLYAGMGEELFYDISLEKRPPEFECEQRNLAIDKPLCRKRIQSVLAYQYYFISDGQSQTVQNDHALKSRLR